MFRSWKNSYAVYGVYVAGRAAAAATAQCKRDPQSRALEVESCAGCLPRAGVDDTLVGYGRVVSDGVHFGYLSDVRCWRRQACWRVGEHKGITT